MAPYFIYNMALPLYISVSAGDRTAYRSSGFPRTPLSAGAADVRIPLMLLNKPAIPTVLLHRIASCLSACFLVTGLCFTGSACGLRGGILVTFDVTGEQYSIFMTSKETIKEVYALQEGKSRATIPNGKLIKGSVPYNKPWNWHIDPQNVVMTQLSIELYNGLPSNIEQDLDYWVYWIQRYAPRSAKIIEVKDYR